MNTLKDVLIVVLLCVIVVLTCLQEGDILDTKGRVFQQEGGLVQLAGGLASVNGGLLPTPGGLDLYYFRAATAMLAVDKRQSGTNVWGETWERFDTSTGTAVFALTGRRIPQSKSSKTRTTTWPCS
jgi:hypothetical protein